MFHALTVLTMKILPSVFQNFIAATKSLLLQDIPEETLNNWAKEVQAEVESSQRYFRWDMAWGRKPAYQ